MSLNPFLALHLLDSMSQLIAVETMMSLVSNNLESVLTYPVNMATFNDKGLAKIATKSLNLFSQFL